jgi:hypothetical protein
MSTLAFRSPPWFKLWALPSVVLARLVEALCLAAEVIAEAQELARAAERRFPFTIDE